MYARLHLPASLVPRLRVTSLQLPSFPVASRDRADTTMSNQFSSENFARIQHDARRLADGADDHEDQLHLLLRSAETAVQHAEAALSQTLQVPQIEPAVWRQALIAQLAR